MRACVILNPKSGSAAMAQQLRNLLVGDDFEIVESQKAGDAAEIARAATGKGYDTVIAGGGDGTVNEVINALVHTPLHSVRMGVLPLGTGNDLSRTLAIPLDIAAAVQTLRDGKETTLDLMKVTTEGQTKYAANVAAGGFTGQMNEALTATTKSTWGPLAYLQGALRTLPDLTAYRTYIRLDDGELKMIDAYNVIIANARTAGGGTVVAPRADPEDGLLDVVIVHQGSAVDIAGVAARLLAGDYTDSDIVSHACAKRIVLFSRPGMWFNVDGDLLTNGPIEFNVVPQALRVVVGETYRHAPDEQQM